MIEVPADKAPTNANVINIMLSTRLRLTLIQAMVSRGSRLCAYGNKNEEKVSLRTDTAVVSHIGYRLVYVIACNMGIIIAKVDIRGAVTQSREAKRDLYINPPFRYRQDPVL